MHVFVNSQKLNINVSLRCRYCLWSGRGGCIQPHLSLSSRLDRAGDMETTSQHIQSLLVKYCCRITSLLIPDLSPLSEYIENSTLRCLNYLRDDSLQAIHTLKNSYKVAQVLLLTLLDSVLKFAWFWPKTMPTLVK